MNNLVITGRIASDIESSDVNGTALAKFRVAVPKRGSDVPNFFSVVVWGKQAEAVTKYLGKGRRVAIQGSLEQNTWEKDGQKRERVEVNAREVEFLDRKPTAVEAPAQTVAEPVAETTPTVPVGELDSVSSVWNPAATGSFQLFTPAG